MRYINVKALCCYDLHLYIHMQIGMKAVNKKEKEIREYISLMKNLENFSEVKYYLDEHRTIDEIVSFVEENCQQYHNRLEEKDKAISALLKKIDPKLQYEDVFTCDLSIRPDKNSEDAYFDMYSSQELSRKLILKNASIKEDLEIIDPWWYELSETSDGYCIEIITDDYKTVKVNCSDIVFEKKFFNAISGISDFKNPWGILSDMSYVICEKERTNPELLNEKEKQILPVLHFVRGVTNRFFSADVSEDVFSAFEILLKNFGFNKGVKLLEKCKLAKDHNQKLKAYRKLTIYLCRAECESLWRNIYNDICESQRGIPFGEYQIKQENLDENRKAITDIFYSKGYKGEYPEFYKENCKKKTACYTSYGISYFAFNEKHVYHIVRVIESPWKPIFSFFSGTVFLKETEYKSGFKPDIFYAMFNAKGRRVYKTVQTFDESVKAEDLAEIAVKRAELKRLTKNEKDCMNEPSARLLLIFALIMALFFGLFFTVVFGGAMLIFHEIVSGEVPELQSFPWLQCFLLSTILFGISLAAIFLFHSEQ